MARRKSAGIKTFTSKGGSVSGVKTGITPARLGSFDPSTGKIYQKPRGRLSEIVGKSVKVVNPAALGFRRSRRGKSLGMGGVGANTPHE